MNTLLGQRLGGKYELQAELGRGGMGIVYRAHDTMLHRTVAVKVLTPQLAADPTFVERFRHEAIAAANLRHPHIATVYDVGQDLVQGDTVHYLVMEFIEGQTLDRVLQRQGQPFSLQQTDQIISQVAQALHYAHQRGMIHRDVKPANIMLGQDGHVTLMDFGLVRAGDLSQLTQTGTALGTPAYMAPEQIMGAEVDQRADIYALGVVIYELLTGDVPFRRTTPLATIHAQVYDPPPPLRERRPELSPAVESVVLRALAKNPGGRYRDVTGLTRDFSRVLAGQMPLGLTEVGDEQAAPSGAT
ncbi:MAG TPA: serine/threonine-protein kinase, partial [Anaerolineae bacterium]|nr:serine/threonine-protein kinase [Anaerolineae bacterium]